MNFKSITEEWATTARTSTMSGDHINVEYFRNSSKYEVARLIKELKENGRYDGIRTILVPFSYGDNGEKICDMRNEADFDDVDMYIWDGNVFHEKAIYEIKKMGYIRKGKEEPIHMLEVFAGVRDEETGVFKIGPFSRSFDKTAIRDKLAAKACAIATKKTGNQVEIEYF